MRLVYKFSPKDYLTSNRGIFNTITCKISTEREVGQVYLARWYAILEAILGV